MSFQSGLKKKKRRSYFMQSGKQQCHRLERPSKLGYLLNWRNVVWQNVELTKYRGTNKKVKSPFRRRSFRWRQRGPFPVANVAKTFLRPSLTFPGEAKSLLEQKTLAYFAHFQWQRKKTLKTLIPVCNVPVGQNKLDRFPLTSFNS
jgi:hypothetical protein